MEKKNIIILIMILIIVLAVFYIFNLENNNHEINNKSYNNSSNLQINNSYDKNSTIYVNSTAKTVNFNNNNVKSVKSNNNDNKNDTNKSIDEALEAKLAVEKYVLNKNEFAGYPIFKDKDGSWLVPIFDKKTKKFKSSVYFYKGGGFVMGPQSYSEYKKIVHENTNYKSDSKKQVKTNKSNNKSNNSVRINIYGKSNLNILNDPIINIVGEQLQKQHENELNQNPELNPQSDTVESSSQEHMEIIGEYGEVSSKLIIVEE